jgi:glycerophosphoryl diester phosphodiesterase
MALEIRDAFRKRLIAAHRGARSLAPENTLASARAAFASGAGMWEIDVRMSRDGELVVIHDPDLTRTSDCRRKFPDRSPWLVGDFALCELKTLDFGSWFARVDPFGQIAAGKVPLSSLAGYSGEPVLTLEEAILFTVRNDWLLDIEIKDLTGQSGHESIVQKVVDLAKSLGATKKILISSFNHDYLRHVKKLDRGVKTGVLENRFQPDPLRLAIELDAFAYKPGLRAVRLRQIHELKRKDFYVIVWTLNSPWLARTLFAIGADGIFTDFPQRFSVNKCKSP